MDSSEVNTNKYEGMGQIQKWKFQESANHNAVNVNHRLRASNQNKVNEENLKPLFSAVA